MPRLVDHAAESLNIDVRLQTTDGQPIVDAPFNDGNLAVRYKRPADVAWQTITLVAGTVGTYTERGWIGFGGGWHQLGLPDAAIVAGRRTLLEITYGDNKPQADSIDAVLGFSTAQATAIAQETADLVLDGFASSHLLLTELGRFISASEIHLRQGDDYLATKGTAWEKLITLAGYDFTQAGLSVRFGAGTVPGEPIITGAASLHETAVGSVKIRLEFTRAQTKEITPGSYLWDVEVVTTENEVKTIDGGVLQLEPSWTTLA